MRTGEKVLWNDVCRSLGSKQELDAMTCYEVCVCSSARVRGATDNLWTAKQ